MERARHYRPRVGRETRLLITTALLAVLALWMLARLRFPTSQVESNSVTEMLSSRGANIGFDGLATQLARTRGLVGGSLLTVELEGTGETASTTLAAYRLGGDVAVVHVPEGRRLRLATGSALLAHDTASGLAVVRLPADPAPSAPTPRVARLPEVPEYVVASTVYADGVALRPVFVAAATRVEAPLWSSVAFVVPPNSGLTPGDFLFTRDGEFSGLAVGVRGSLALVSADTVLDEANRLIANPVPTPPDYGIEVHGLSPALERALGTAAGVVVAWVNPAGPSRGVLMPRNVIEGVDGQSLPGIEHWRRHVAGRRADTPITLTLRRSGATSQVVVTPVASKPADDEEAPAVRRALGVAMKAVRGRGSEVTSVEPASVASQAGLMVGDIITALGDVTAPMPSQIARAAASLRDGHRVVVTVQRGDLHHLLVFEP